jgi:hypothetical protein
MTQNRASFNGSLHRRYGFIAIALFCFTAMLSAQPSRAVSDIEIGTVKQGSPVTLQVSVLNLSSYSRIELAYRAFGVSEFRRMEMQFLGGAAIVSIPAGDVLPPYIEYYLLLTEAAGGTVVTHPEENAELQPLRIVVPTAEESRALTVLSPNPGEEVSADDLLISFSLFRADSAVDRNATRILLNGADVTDMVVRSEDLFVFHPERATVMGGAQNLSVLLFDTTGKEYETSGWSFSVSSVTPGASRQPAAGAWLYGGSVLLESRSEEVGGGSQTFNRGTINAWTGDETFKFTGKLFLTNEEKGDRQPQNRYFIGGESPWLRIGYGDHNPTFSDLVMNGKRVRGLQGILELKAFNLDVTYGQLDRAIDGSVLKSFPYDSLLAEQLNDPGASFRLLDSAVSPDLWGKVRNGTFERKILVVRPSFGTKEKAQLGFTYLKSSDETGSIHYGIRPEENMVVGSDLTMAFDDRNVEIKGEAAFSATNHDISRGSLSDDDIDGIFSDSAGYSSSDRDRIKVAKKILESLITFNEHLVPLSLNNLATLAYEGGLSLNYFNNLFRANYLRRGSAFESFGQSYLRTDVKGYQVSDRLRLMQNNLVLSAGYERLQDNTANTSAWTTTFSTLTTAVSYFSRTEFPGISVGYSRESNSNGWSDTVNVANGDTTLIAFPIDDATNRFFIQLQRQFIFAGRHDVSLNVSLSDRNDVSVFDRDSKTTTVGLSSYSYYTIPLQTILSVSFTSNSFVDGSGSVKRSYTTIYANGQYRLLEDKLRLFGTVSPSFGDLERVLFELGGQYYFTRTLSAQTQLSRYFNTNATNDLIFSLILRLDV